ncbi:unnamed protein product, partial [Ranitomeya imitator]
KIDYRGRLSSLLRARDSLSGQETCGRAIDGHLILVFTGLKKRRNWHRHDYTEADDGSKPVQAGTRTFVQQLRARSFPSADDIILRMNGSHLTQRYLEKHGFNSPIIVPQIEGLGLRLPPPTFSVMDVERYVGTKS